MVFADVHCHLSLPQFTLDRRQVVERAVEAGLGLIVEAGIDGKTNLQALSLSEEFPIVKPAFGISPTTISRTPKDTLERWMCWIEDNVEFCCGLGEVGLDYHWRQDHKDLMKDWFRRFIDLAHRHKKSLIVHSRGAEDDVVSMLEDVEVPVVLHCFSESDPVLLERILANEKLFISVPTTLSWSKKAQRIVSFFPLERLLTETDSPFLWRKARNEPKNVVETVQLTSILKNIPCENVEYALYSNARGVFS